MLAQLIDNAEKLPDYDLAAWKPVFNGDMDLVIAADGDWYHQGTAIVRPKIKQLFARLLQRQANGDYWIITPVEAFRITVVDLPFVVVIEDFVNEKGQGIWQFTTNMGDVVCLNQADHLVVTYDSEQPQPQLFIREGLWGRINRPVFYQLALASTVVESAQGDFAQLASGVHQYNIGQL